MIRTMARSKCRCGRIISPPSCRRIGKPAEIVDCRVENSAECGAAGVFAFSGINQDFWSRGFVEFIDKFNGHRFQFDRFMSHIGLVRDRGNYVPMNSSGYASPWPYVKLQISNKAYRYLLLKGLRYLLKPTRALTLAKAFVQGRRHSPQGWSDFLSVYFYWIYTWTNLALKYEGLGEEDFAVCIRSPRTSINRN